MFDGVTDWSCGCDGCATVEAVTGGWMTAAESGHDCRGRRRLYCIVGMTGDVVSVLEIGIEGGVSMWGRSAGDGPAEEDGTTAAGRESATAGNGSPSDGPAGEIRPGNSICGRKIWDCVECDG